MLNSWGQKEPVEAKWGFTDVYVRWLRTKRDSWGRNEVLLTFTLDGWGQKEKVILTDDWGKETVEDEMRFY